MPIIIAICAGIAASLYWFGMIVALIIAALGCLLLGGAWLLAALERDDLQFAAAENERSRNAAAALLTEAQDEIADLKAALDCEATAAKHWQVKANAMIGDRRSAIADAMEEHYKND